MLLARGLVAERVHAVSLQLAFNGKQKEMSNGLGKGEFGRPGGGPLCFGVAV